MSFDGIKHICVVTTSRADYGLLRPLLQTLPKHGFNVQLLAIGSHAYLGGGGTADEIYKDSFISPRVISHLSIEDSPIARASGLGDGIPACTKYFLENMPDLVIVLGDRFELLAAVISAHLLSIPIAHLHGGELSFGAWDDAIRHAITKFSALHFVSHQTYADRVIQMGEHPGRVHNVGALAVDVFTNVPNISLSECASRMNRDLKGPLVLLTYHPVTLVAEENDMTPLLAALDSIPDIQIIVTGSNLDGDHSQIETKIKQFVTKDPYKRSYHHSLGSELYVNLLRQVDLVIGNSSSGILEAPYCGTPVINIGSRQDGRIKPESVISVPMAQHEIKAAIKQALTPEHKAECQTAHYPFGVEGVADRIAEILKGESRSRLQMKHFFDKSVA